MSSFDIGRPWALDDMPITEQGLEEKNELMNSCGEQSIDWDIFEAWREGVKPFLAGKERKC